jgi:hypothetical protein
VYFGQSSSVRLVHPLRRFWYVVRALFDVIAIGANRRNRGTAVIYCNTSKARKGSKHRFECPLLCGPTYLLYGETRKTNFESSRCVRFCGNENAFQQRGTTASKNAFVRFYRARRQARTGKQTFIFATRPIADHRYLHFKADIPSRRRPRKMNSVGTTNVPSQQFFQALDLIGVNQIAIDDDCSGPRFRKRHEVARITRKTMTGAPLKRKVR